MSVQGEKFYPGDNATPEELLRLAAEYRSAAERLRGQGRKREPLSLSPYRLAVLRSVELYLDAYLRTKGHKPSGLRGKPHNYAIRTELAVEAGLRLRDRTVAHLNDMTNRREYLVARYDPDPRDKQSELTSLQATLSDVSNKVEAVLNRKKP